MVPYPRTEADIGFYAMNSLQLLKHHISSTASLFSIPRFIRFASEMWWHDRILVQKTQDQLDHT